MHFYNYNFFKIVKFYFVIQDIVYIGDCSMHLKTMCIWLLVGVK